MHPRLDWRKHIHEAACLAAQNAGIVYQRDDRLEIEVILYLTAASIRWHDLDNRLKDVLDALQGRLDGPKARRNHTVVIPNDSQIFRAEIRKTVPPSQSHGWGHVTVNLYRERQ